MAKLPTSLDPTLEAADAALQRLRNREPRRPYFGMSSVGDPCKRKLWLGYRWCTATAFDAPTLKRFADGHLGELVMGKRLNLVPRLNLQTVDPVSGQQFACIDHAGHFRGHLDGTIKGLLQAPGTLHVWEHKQVGVDKYKKLCKLQVDMDGKGILEKWNPIYYAQAVIYMHYRGIKRHYLTCSTPGGRETTSVRTNSNAEKAAVLVEKAKTIIEAPEPPEGISTNPGWYQCKMCDHYGFCHGGQVPEVNCRTCCYSTPMMVGEHAGHWICAWRKTTLTVEEQRKGCPDHVFLPALVPLKQLDSDDKENWVSYQNGEHEIKNGKNHYSSQEMHANLAACGAPQVEMMKERFDAEVVT